jgi:hypothetical protein
LAERGVLESTFVSHGGEIDSSPHCSEIAERLNRVRLSEAWRNVESILWFPVHGFNGDRHWLARPLPELKKGEKKIKFVATNGSRSIPWIPSATRDVAKDVGVPLLFTGEDYRRSRLSSRPIPIPGNTASWTVLQVLP